MNDGRQCRSRDLLGFPPELCLGHHAAARLGTGTRPAALLDPATSAGAQTRPAFRVLHGGWGCRSCSRLVLPDSREVASPLEVEDSRAATSGRGDLAPRRIGAVQRCPDTGVQVPFHRGVDKRGTPLSKITQWRTFCEATPDLPLPPCVRVDRSSLLTEEGRMHLSQSPVPGRRARRSWFAGRLRNSRGKTPRAGTSPWAVLLRMRPPASTSWTPRY